MFRDRGSIVTPDASSLGTFTLSSVLPQLPDVSGSIEAATRNIGGIFPPTAPFQEMASPSIEWIHALVSDPSVQAVLNPILQVLGHVDPQARPLLLAPLLLVASAKVLDTWGTVGSEGGGAPASPYSGGQQSYDDRAAKEFYGARPLLVIKRLLSLAQLTGLFNVKLLLDYLRTPEGAESWINEEDRAKESLVLANQMGPTFIKLGQAASIRTDLIPEAYALELRQLQDAVPPFDNEVAMQVLRKELGVSDLSTVFASLSPEPVASASIGQVYKGTLRSNGKEVAVKVQRPTVLSEIALDLFLLRLLTPLQVRVSNAINKVSTDPGDIDTALALVDEWGRGFVAEVDYRLEAKNTREFKAAMARRNLDAVTAPVVVEDLSTSAVLVTEWVEGTRLDRDASPDVPRLCGVAVNAYLTMLLDTGCLHCDPHPGNLLRTTDGKLCVLDWGMTLQVPSDLQYALLEFIAHVNSQEYEAIPQDFVNLGFTPPDKLEKVQSSGITEGLTFALRQLSQGGGAKKMQARLKDEFASRYGEGLSDEEIRARARAEMLERMEAQLEAEGVDVNQVTNVMEEMSKRNRELFKLPPYVLYVSRAFSTLEGIGLSLDEDYAILQECYPYLAKRLLSDNSPRARSALLSMLYGASNPESSSGSDANGERLMATAHQQQQAGRGGAAFAAQGVAEAAAAAATTAADGLSHSTPPPPRRPSPTGVGGKTAGGGALLSAEKVVEMTSGFTSYTAATASAVSNQGLVEARNSLVDLVLADFDASMNGGEGLNGGGREGPNVVQEVLVEETARLIDAALASALAAPVTPVAVAAQGDSGSSSSAPAPPQLPLVSSLAESAVGSFLNSGLVPAPLKPLAESSLEVPLRINRQLEQTLRAAVPSDVRHASAALFDTRTAEDEKVLGAASSLLQAALTSATSASDVSGTTSSTADGSSAAGVAVAPSPDAVLGTARSAVEALVKVQQGDVGDSSDAELLSKLVNKGPGAASRLSRLLAASLLTRAANRLDAATEAQLARGVIKADGVVAGARAVATENVLDPLLTSLKRT